MGINYKYKGSKMNIEQAVILAGGFGTRISEETHLKPKPMVEIGDRPIIWHIMKYYAHFGVNDFIICCGYKSAIIKNYFLNYHYENSDYEINLANNKVTGLKTHPENWKIRLVDTGTTTMTGGRL